MTALTALLLVVTITSMVTNNVLNNHASKKYLKTSDDVHGFNLIAFAVCVLIFGVLSIFGSISLYSVLLGAVFGIVTALQTFCIVKALGIGPMHITLLICTSAMIIPTMSGIFFGEGFSLWKAVCVVFLIFFIYLSLGKEKGKGVNKKWLLFCTAAFFLGGSVGVLQKIHQSSPHKEEVAAFLLVAFIFSVLYNRVMMKKSPTKLGFSKSTVIIALVCGVSIFIMNYINLVLSGIIPSQLFFPLIDGSAVVISSLVSLFFFKEKLSALQLVGVCGGLATLVAICFVP